MTNKWIRCYCAGNIKPPIKRMQSSIIYLSAYQKYVFPINDSVKDGRVLVDHEEEVMSGGGGLSYLETAARQGGFRQAAKGAIVTEFPGNEKRRSGIPGIKKIPFPWEFLEIDFDVNGRKVK